MGREERRMTTAQWGLVIVLRVTLIICTAIVIACCVSSGRASAREQGDDGRG